MPNVGAVLKEEIGRLSRKEVRRQLAGIKKPSAQYRRHIAVLRRQIGSLVRQLSTLGKQRLVMYYSSQIVRFNGNTSAQ